MDRAGRSQKLLMKSGLGWLVALAGFTACATGASSIGTQSSALDLPELAWFPSGLDRVTALTEGPLACLASAKTAGLQDQLALGEIIFHSPALLGGQAEKKGLSCGSCHQNGRGNPHFQFEAISGAQGTADVTSGLFSQVRADNQFNPVPIPDLALPDGQDQIDRSDRHALADFVRAQIVEEFSGDNPPAEIFEPLLTYLQAIDASEAACATDETHPVDWSTDWRSAQMAARQAQTVQSAPARAFYIRTARISLGRLHARYSAAAHADIRQDLVALSRSLGSGSEWPDDLETLPARLKAEAPASLYAPATLSEALQAAKN